MPDIKCRFQVKAGPEAVEALLGDFHKVYYLFPAFASAEEAPDGYRWYMKVPAELEAGAHFLTARILNRNPGMIHWEAVSPTLVWKGDFAWTAQNDRTEITLHLEIHDEGLAGSMHEALLSVELPELVRYFQTRCREILETKSWLNGLP